MDLATFEPFARRPRNLLPTRIRCAAISPAGPPSRCSSPAAVATDVCCRSCGARRVFLCDGCLDEAQWLLEPGLLWCAADGARISVITSSTRLQAVPGG